MGIVGPLMAQNNLGDVDTKSTSRFNLAVPVICASKAAIAALDPAKDLSVILDADGIGGTFVVLTLASLSIAEQAAVALDTANGRGIYIVPAADVTKVYKRIYSGDIDVDWFGAVGDTTSVVATLTITSTQFALTATGATFTAADVGKTICVYGAGTAGGILFTTIAAFGSATSITLADAAVTSLVAAVNTELGSGTALATLRYWTDNRAIIQNAINVALALGGANILFSAGLYGVSTLAASLDPGVGNLRFLGVGGSGLCYFEGNSNAISTNYLFKNIANVTKQALRFESVNFFGTLDLFGRRGRTALFLDYYTDVYLDKCTWYNVAAEAMDFHFLHSFFCLDGTFTNIAADGVRCRDTPNCMVDGNEFFRVGDDSIALHCTDVVNARRGLEVVNNRITVGGGIKCLGGRKTRIAGNHLDLPNVTGIQIISATSGTEGNVPLFDISITDNVIENLVDIPVGGVPVANSSAITVNNAGFRGSTATHSVPPGFYDNTGAAWVYPWTYNDTFTDVAANAIPPLSGLVISGNVVRRTRPTAAAFYDYGFGTAIEQGVSYNPAITDTNLRQAAAVSISGGALWDSTISDNIFNHVVAGISFAAPAFDLAYRNVSIKDNDISDYTARGIQVATAAFHVQMKIENNFFGGDMYRAAANSNLDGTYAATGVPNALDTGNLLGVEFSYNSVQNVCVVVQSNVLASMDVRENMLFAALPAAIGFNVSNRGIGNCPRAGGRFRYTIINADPTSATYGAVVTVETAAAASIPTTGSWVIGAFVRNEAPVIDGSNMMIGGWLRLTTGAANVSGTDWGVGRVSNVSPAT